MFTTKVLVALTAFLAASGTNAWSAPGYSGYNKVWEASFIGPADGLPSSSNWNYITGDRNDNNEFQRYTSSKNNVRMTGKGTLQIIPRKDRSAPKGWTSARLETKNTVTPQAGKITRIEASLRVAGNPRENKQGMWYAFWLMGQSYRQGVAWPGSGELDVFESINGEPQSHAVAHCDVYPGGLCNEPYGLVNTHPLTDAQFHVWRMEWDRRSNDFRQQSISWFVDGKLFHKISGLQIPNEGVWARLAHQPYYFILNVAVGGNWPGPPNDKTWDGSGQLMEVGYIGHWVSQ